MKFLRLPSGRGVNVDNIRAWNTPIKANSSPGDTLDDAIHILFNSEGDMVRYRGADARALYAWLTANSTPIGEDGREVGAEKSRIGDDLSEAQWAVLELLAQDMDTASMFGDLERKTRITMTEFEALERLDLIKRNRHAFPHTFELTSKGYVTVVGDEG